MTTNDDERTLIEVRADAPSAYWGGWAEVADIEHDIDATGTVILATVRSGRDGRSDAQYIVDRLASGLHFGRTIPAYIWPDPNNEGGWIDAWNGAYTTLEEALQDAPAGVGRPWVLARGEGLKDTDAEEEDG